jgi:tetratricopeptide (TPR) repeat protein
MQLPTIFISYSHKDKDLKDSVVTQLRVLEKYGRLQVWDDDVINAGELWLEKIKEAIKKANAAILLVSANFLTSEFIKQEEIPRLLQRHKNKSLHIFPFIIKDCPWSHLDWLNELQVRPKGAKPLFSYRGSKRDEVLTEFVEEIHGLLIPQVESRPPGISISTAHLPRTGTKLFGRKKELRLLDKAWADQKTNIVSFVAWGGVGKSALVNHWLRRMRLENYRGAEKVFGLSFYSQGTREQAGSADLFMTSALEWFGDTNPNQGAPEQKGKRLVKLIREHRTLLILDGLEPLQIPPGESMGRFRNPGIRLLLQELASHNTGLCVLSSRLPLTDLTDFIGTTVRQEDLEKLSSAAGRRLLESEGANGPADEMEKASEEFGGHALALSILGDFIKMAWHGDIRRRDRVGPLIHNPEHGGHARRVIESYARWFRDNPKQQVEFESLQMLGLFDRPIEPGAWKVLIEKPAIRGLTDNISRADESRWRTALGVLRGARLLAEKDADSPATIDCHPLIREHFSDLLRNDQATAWKKAHERLFKFFHHDTTQLPKTVEAMAPYYQAITHACFAGRYREAFDKVYMPYIRQGATYNTDTLRAFDDDYAALSRFLRKGRFEVVSQLRDQGSFILGEIGFDLRALGRLDDALDAMEAALKADEASSDSVNAPAQAAILSHTYLIRGQIRQAITSADRGANLAAGKRYFRMVNIANRADARHHAGELELALEDFAEAERLSLELFGSPLRSLLGCRYCDCLLTMGEYSEVLKRTKETLKWDKEGGYELDDLPAREHHKLRHALQLQGAVVPLALNRLVRCRALLQKFERTASPGSLISARGELEKALQSLRVAETRHEMPRGLLIKAELLRLEKNFIDARHELQAILSIVRDGKMELYEAEAHLQLAWLALRESKSTDAIKSLEKVRSLISKLGYYRLTPQADEIETRLREGRAGSAG